MSKLSSTALVKELGSPRFWRRQTARRLLVERRATEAMPLAQALLASARSDTATALGALYTLEGWDALSAGDLLAAWRHPAPDVKRHALRLADTRFAGLGQGIEVQLLDASHSLAAADPRVALQAALSLGHARGIVLLAAASEKIPVHECSALEVKKAVVGYGRAEKSQVQEMVKLILRIRGSLAPDSADALALALCYMNAIKFNESVKGR